VIEMVKGRNIIIAVLLFLIIGGGIYYWGGRNKIPSPARFNYRPANTDIATGSQLINNDTNIIYEREYLRSQVVVISGFGDKQAIINHGIEEIRNIYTSEQGYTIYFQDNNLIIHQKIDDWTPEDKQKFRLKEYKGHLAVYQGPDAENDVMIRITSLQFSKMPADIQAAISAGKYEFKSEEELNDALENLDEYL
jgi:hypothetical protein